MFDNVIFIGVKDEFNCFAVTFNAGFLDTFIFKKYMRKGF